MLAGAAQVDWKGHDRACAPQPDVISTVRPEIAAAGVQALDRAGVANDVSIPVERQHSIRTAVQEQQSLLAVDSEAARISNATILAEGAEWPTVTIKGEERAISVAVDTGCTRHEKGHSHGGRLPQHAGRSASHSLTGPWRYTSVCSERR
jgi:hypothetical protein